MLHITFSKFIRCSTPHPKFRGGGGGLRPPNPPTVWRPWKPEETKTPHYGETILHGTELLH